MDDDSIAILTLPFSNDLNPIYHETNNILLLVVLVFEIFLLIALVLLAFLIPNYGIVGSHPSSLFLTNNSLVVYIHLAVWLIILLIRAYKKRIYYKRLLVVGYHRHHKKVSWISNVPAFVLHKANAVLLLIFALLCKYEANNEAIHLSLGINVTLKIENLLQLVISISVLLVEPFLIVQLVNEVRFRRDRRPPDVFCIDDPQHLQQAGLSEGGLRPSTYLEDLLEKQADLINNLKLQNYHLRLTLFKLSQSRESSSDAHHCVH